MLCLGAVRPSAALGGITGTGTRPGGGGDGDTLLLINPLAGPSGTFRFRICLGRPLRSRRAGLEPAPQQSGTRFCSCLLFFRGF